MKFYLLISAILGFMGVAAGAFGAHALKTRISQEMLNVFEVGVRYQMYHLFAIICAVWLKSPLAALFFLIGIIVFSGSLYALSLTSIKWLGAITPFGGVLLLAGWFTLALSIYNTKF
jgi:uncharacterized membrane protein YgdD (TMEM256/DUF423 family)